MRRLFRSTIVLAVVLSTLTTVAIPASASQQGNTAELRITLRACPDGVDPNVDTSECTIPLDAPDASVLLWADSSVQIAHEVERDTDGTYVIPNAPADEYMVLQGFEPVEHNHFMFIDHGDDNDDFATNNDKWHPDMELVTGETREISVFYWNGPDGLNPETETSLGLTFRGCPEGVDPTKIEDPAAECTTPLDAPAESIYSTGSDEFLPITELPRADDGTYLISGQPAFTVVEFGQLHGINHDRPWVTEPAGISGPVSYRVHLDRGLQANVTIYYYNAG
jgi:hypothetical protein